MHICESGLPEAFRPSRCGSCMSKRRPHRHGRFFRWLFTLTEAILIPLYRFRCSDCRKTTSVIPLFVESHHQSAVDVKEAVIRSGEEGSSLAAIASESATFSGGQYAEKTIWRWQQCWRRRRDRIHEQIWRVILHNGIDFPLPRERCSVWRALWMAWSRLSRPDNLFHEILRLDRLRSVTATV